MGSLTTNANQMVIELSQQCVGIAVLRFGWDTETPSPLRRAKDASESVAQNKKGRG